MHQWLDLLLSGSPQALSAVALTQDPVIPPDFRERYQTLIVPHLLAFEEHRVSALHSIRKRLFIALPVCGVIAALIAYFYWCCSGSGDSSDVPLNLGFAAMAGVLFWVFAAQRQYVGKIKTTIFPIIFGHFGPQFSYSKNGTMPMSELKHFGIIPDHTDSILSDFVRGSHREVPIEIEQAKLTSGSGKDKSVVFEGLLVRLSVHKNFKGRTVIRKDAGILGNWTVGTSGLQRAHLEDPTFEKLFEVGTTDQIEARYLLTTSFMERLVQLRALFGGTLEASFSQGNLLLAIESHKDWFEPTSITQPATFKEDICTILEQMRLLFQIIEVLKLDDTTRL